MLGALEVLYTECVDRDDLDASLVAYFQNLTFVSAWLPMAIH